MTVINPVQKFLQAEYDALAAVDRDHDLCKLHEQHGNSDFMDKVRERFPSQVGLDFVSLMKFANAMEHAARNRCANNRR